MRTLTLKEIKKGEAFASYELIENIIGKVKENDLIINFAYTDYGGDFFDKVAISYFKEHYPDNIIIENTCYYGENAFLFGKIAEKFWQETENYLLGFETLEDYYSGKVYLQSIEDFKFFLDDCKNDFLFDFENVLEWLTENKSGYYCITTQGLDFSYENLINELIKEGLFYDKEDNLLYYLVSNGIEENIAKYYANNFENDTLKELNLSNEILNLFNLWKQ